jgi:hypothetical protein
MKIARRRLALLLPLPVSAAPTGGWKLWEG